MQQWELFWNCDKTKYKIYSLARTYVSLHELSPKTWDLFILLKSVLLIHCLFFTISTLACPFLLSGPAAGCCVSSGCEARFHTCVFSPIMHLVLTTLCLPSPIQGWQLRHPPSLFLFSSLPSSTAHVFFSAPPVCSSSLSRWFWLCSSALGWDLICLPGLMSLTSRAEQLLAPQVAAAGAVNWCLWVNAARTGECFQDGRCCRFSTHLFEPQLGELSLFPPSFPPLLR